MRIPKTPPKAWEFEGFEGGEAIRLSQTPECAEFIADANRKYLHWDKLRYYPRPDAIESAEAAWYLVWLSRTFQRSSLGLDIGVGSPSVWMPPHHQKWIHFIDQNAGGSISTVADNHPYDSERYLVNSLMEEAIASSQLEGATTTRVIAKRMLRSKRKPKDRAERMIRNNYNAILEIRELKGDKLTPDMMKHIQEIITDQTLDDPSAAGRFRNGDDHVTVVDNYDNVVFDPPPFKYVEAYVEAICKFANETSGEFVHPVIKAIAIHFAIGYTHPFVDGNGRTARALFYWFMLKNGYWLFEYLPISRIFLNAPVKYAKAYLHTETDNCDLTYFSDYHLKVVVRAIEELHKYLAEQARATKEARDLLSGWSDTLNHRQTALVHDAVKHPGKDYTISDHAGTYNVAKATARADLLELKDLHLFSMEKEGNKLVFAPLKRIVSKLKARLPKD